jgi:lipopolysaccharide transport system ATP-binding protein
MDQDASGYDNIFLRGIIMGLTPKEIRQKSKDIAEFTELGEFLNLPIRTYSSGMQLRLAFAISTSVQADIIIMDEWLSVGDKSFMTKASDRLQKLVDEAAILVIATHDSNLVNKICNRAFRMEQGRIAEEFAPVAIAENKSNIEKL